MSKKLDLTGKKFGRLTVIEQSLSKNKKALWKCKCECGNEVIAKSDKLQNGRTKSCGCLHREIISAGINKTHGVSKSRLYAIWSGMITRCENPNRKKHKKDYQDRGITVYQEWHSFELFQEWALANGYAENLTIERIDNNKGYSPDNCKWADNKTQANNRRICINITFNGVTQTIAQWAEEIGMKYTTLYQRFLNGWDTERALTTPLEEGRV
ncbi:MAG: hypothetical protein LBQ89_08205 [Treponema sp.]|jgi:hypothetical protein|nr:hypothetical protein [Treponema sp.]